MEIVLGSDQDRPNLFAELRVGGQPWAEVIYDSRKEAYILTNTLSNKTHAMSLGSGHSPNGSVKFTGSRRAQAHQSTSLGHAGRTLRPSDSQPCSGNEIGP
jgi:hypothetical protein